MNDVVCVKINGLNLKRIVDRLVENNVFVGNLAFKSKYIKFNVYEKDLKKLKYICNKEHKTYEIVWRNGLKNVLFGAKRYFGFFVASLLCFCYIFSFNVYIHKINLISSKEYDIQKVEKLLTENNIKNGMLKQNYNAKNIENLLLEKFDDLSGCSIELVGGNLNISLFPATLKQEEKKKQIVSDFDGVIKELEVFKGISNFKIGDIVRKGDVIVFDEEESIAKIKLKAYFIATEVYLEKQIKEEKTGNVLYEKKFFICNKLIENKQKHIGFANYLTEKCDFYIINNFILPVKCEIIRYSETVIKEEIIPFEFVEETLKQKLYSEASEKIPGNAAAVGVKYLITNEGAYTKLDCYIECEVVI